MKFGVIGSGVIGSSWTSLFLSHGFDVVLFGRSERSLRKALEKIEENLKFLREHRMVKNEGSLELTTKVEDLKGVDYLQESVSEDLELKREILSSIEKICNENVIFASSTSGLSVTEIQKSLKHPERFIVAHPINPPHLIPLIEIVPGELTSEETIKRTYEIMENLSRVPVILKKEVPGFVVNRLAVALWREAIDLVMNGVVEVEDIDKIVSHGPGLRWAIMGPFLIYHLGGGEGGIKHFLEHLSDAISFWWSTMNTWTEMNEEMKRRIVEGVEKEVKGKNIKELERKRDELLVALLKLRDLA